MNVAGGLDLVCALWRHDDVVEPSPFPTFEELRSLVEEVGMTPCRTDLRWCVAFRGGPYDGQEHWQGECPPKIRFAFIPEKDLVPVRQDIGSPEYCKAFAKPVHYRHHVYLKAPLTDDPRVFYDYQGAS